MPDSSSTRSFSRPRWVKKAIAAGGAYHSMKKEPWRHNSINLAASLSLLAVFAGGVALAAVLPWWGYLPAAAVIFGSVYFAVNILVIHECSHNMFVLTRDRKRQKKLNRFFGKLAAVPFFTEYVKHWEQGHTTHHLRPCEPDDPQDADPLTGGRLYRRIALILTVPGAFLPFNPSRQYPGQLKRAALGLGLFWIPVGVATGLLVSWMVPVAMVLGLHVTLLFNMLKKAQEHGAGLADEPDFALRSRTYFYPLALIASPFNINYHFEHHANFNVPWYDLPRYHKALQDIVPDQLKPYYFHRDYTAQLRGIKELPPRELLGISAT